uniref:Uncharacterized protein n=1 Tax=Rhizophora mucronata TaxID=61149 RepID=A0A2P2MBG9_RHIMU
MPVTARERHDSNPGVGTRSRAGTTVVLSRDTSSVRADKEGNCSPPRPRGVLHPTARPSDRAPELPRTALRGARATVRGLPRAAVKARGQEGTQSYHKDFPNGNATQEPLYFTSTRIETARVREQRGSEADSSTLERGSCQPLRPYYRSCTIAYTKRQPHQAYNVPEELFEPRERRSTRQNRRPHRSAREIAWEPADSSLGTGISH